MYDHTKISNMSTTCDNGNVTLKTADDNYNAGPQPESTSVKKPSVMSGPSPEPIDSNEPPRRWIKYIKLPIIKVQGSRDQLMDEAWVHREVRILDKEALKNMERYDFEIPLYFNKKPPQNARCTHYQANNSCDTGWCYVAQKQESETLEILQETQDSHVVSYIEECAHWGGQTKGTSFTFHPNGTWIMYCIEGCIDS